VARVSAAFSLAGVNTASTVLANLKAAASDLVELLEVGFFIEVAPTTAPIPSLQRMNAAGTGAITSTAGVIHDPNQGAATAVLETAWATTKPTLVANSILRRLQLPLAVGNGVIWDFTNRPIRLPVSAGLCLVNIAASGATLGQFGGWFTWDE
jgi:hypothetical protein